LRAAAKSLKASALAGGFRWAILMSTLALFGAAWISVSRRTS
jgi:hypothetical protein